MAQPQALGGQLSGEISLIRPFHVLHKIKYDHLIDKANRALSINDPKEKSRAYAVRSTIHLNYFEIEKGLSDLDSMLSLSTKWALVGISNAIVILVWRNQVNYAISQLSKSKMDDLVLETPELYSTLVTMAAYAGYPELAQKIESECSKLPNVKKKDVLKARANVSNIQKALSETRTDPAVYRQAITCVEKIFIEHRVCIANISGMRPFVMDGLADVCIPVLATPEKTELMDQHLYTMLREQGIYDQIPNFTFMFLSRDEADHRGN